MTQVNPSNAKEWRDYHRAEFNACLSIVLIIVFVILEAFPGYLNNETLFVFPFLHLFLGNLIFHLGIMTESFFKPTLPEKFRKIVFWGSVFLPILFLLMLHFLTPK